MQSIKILSLRLYICVHYLVLSKRMKFDILVRNIFLFIAFGIIVPIVLLFVYLLFDLFYLNRPITNVQKYENVLSSIEKQSEINHFPKEIPLEAKDVKFYYWTSSTNGSLLLLQFKINEKYIQNELKRLSFINYYQQIGCRQNIYHFPYQKGFINPNNLTFFVLKNKDNEYIFKKYFPYFSGIGIDRTMEHIVYYYIEPDD